VTARSKGLLTFDRLAISTQIELQGLWERGSGATEAGKVFFSFMFNRDFDNFPPDSQRELDALMEGLMRDQAGILSHDHFLYVVRRGNARHLITDAQYRGQEPFI
jgi:hypothetical protein